MALMFAVAQLPLPAIAFTQAAAAISRYRRCCLFRADISR